jgi:hypothetical protein
MKIARVGTSLSMMRAMRMAVTARISTKNRVKMHNNCG